MKYRSLAFLAFTIALTLSGCAGIKDVTADSRYHGSYDPTATYKTKKLLFLHQEAFWNPYYGGTPPSLEAFQNDKIGTYKDVTGAILPGTRIRIDSIQVNRFGGTVGRITQAYGVILDGDLAGARGTLMTISRNEYVRKLGVSVPLVPTDILEVEK
jgi:hypothetical protein